MAGNRSTSSIARGLAVLALAAPLVQASGASAAPAGTRVDAAQCGPHSRSDYSELNGLSMLSASDIWAVGAVAHNRGYYALTCHWDGQAWWKVPIHASGGDVLFDVAAVSHDNVWAVGVSGIPGESNLVVHWDGKSWQRIDVPDPLGQTPSLTRVSAISADNVIATGIYYPRGEAGPAAYQTLRWNGSSWTLAHPEAEPVRLADALTPKDAWGVAVGQEQGLPPALRHWDGESWQTVASPHSAHGERLSAITTVAPDDAWAGGQTYGADGHVDGGWLVHWDGDAWTAVDAPSFEVDALSGSGPDDVWLVSYYADPGEQTQHWDGRTWSTEAVPETPGGGVSDIVAVSPTDAWAVGLVPSGSGSYQRLLVHWDGSAWSAYNDGLDAGRG